VKRFVSLQLHNLIDGRWDSLDGGSAGLKGATYTGQHKHRINADRRPCLEWDSNLRSQCLNGRRCALDRMATVFGSVIFIC
jgi:hypothetical protein